MRKVTSLLIPPSANNTRRNNTEKPGTEMNHQRGTRKHNGNERKGYPYHYGSPAQQRKPVMYNSNSNVLTRWE